MHLMQVHHFVLSALLLCVASGIKTPPPIRHVVLLGIDGLRPACIPNATSHAGFDEMAAAGSSIMDNARTTIQTLTAPGWSTTLCSMRPALTGVTSNSWTPPWVPPSNPIHERVARSIAQAVAKGTIDKQSLGGPGAFPITPVTGTERPFPCMFEVLKNVSSDWKTSFYYDWDWLSTLSNGGMYDPATNESWVDDDWLCEGALDVCDRNITDRFLAQHRTTDLSFDFVYFHNVDGTGHASNWCSDKYEAAVGLADELLQKVMSAIDFSDTLFVVTADHGGVPGHNFHSWGGQFAIVIPWMMRGPGVKVNYKLQVAPRNEDIMPTVLAALGQSPPSVWTGKPIMEIFDWA